MFHFIELNKEIGYLNSQYIEYIKPDKSDKIIEFSDEFIIIKREKWYLKTLIKYNITVFIIVFIIVMILALFNDNSVNEFYSDIIKPITKNLLYLYVLTNLFQVYYLFFSKKKEIVFDRLNGDIYLPQLFFLKTRKIKLRVLEGYYTHKSSDGIMDESDISSSTTNFYLTGKYDGKKYKYKKVIEYNTTSKAPVHGLWSFILWYMDKNRPLPIDKEFDLYREKDYQRRKKEGFYSPLIHSDIYKVENIY